MACPHVAGALALLIEAEPTKTLQEIETILKDQATEKKVRDPKPGSPDKLLHVGPGTWTKPPTPRPIPTPRPTPVPTPAPGPIPVADAACNFEDGAEETCKWMQDKTDVFDWTRKSGRTPSGRTGPPKAKEGSYYMYIETSNPRQTGDMAILKSHPIVLTGPMKLVFLYHTYGATVGYLKVKVDDRIAFSSKVNLGDEWHYGVVPVTGTPTISFIGIRGTSYTGDIAIDDVRLEPADWVTPIIVTIGKSNGVKKCVTRAKVVCPDNAGNQNIRWNQDHDRAKDSFTITREGSDICAKRLDANSGWGMNLKLKCAPETSGTPQPIPLPTPSPTASGSPAPPVVVVGPPGLPGPPGPPGKTTVNAGPPGPPGPPR